MSICLLSSGFDPLEIFLDNFGKTYLLLDRTCALYFCLISFGVFSFSPAVMRWPRVQTTRLVVSLTSDAIKN